MSTMKLGLAAARTAIAALLAATAFHSAAAYQARCTLCARSVVLNSELAACFLEKYDVLAERSANAVVVDLSDCEIGRGVVEALPMPEVEQLEPDLQFVVSPAQLDCLRTKLEEPGLVLDPAARIDLESCG